MFLFHRIDQCLARVSYPRFDKVANVMPKGTGDHLATKSYREATRACYKKIAVLMRKSSIGSEVLEKWCKPSRDLSVIRIPPL